MNKFTVYFFLFLLVAAAIGSAWAGWVTGRAVAERVVSDGKIQRIWNNLATGKVDVDCDCYRDENGECHYFPAKPPGYWDKFTKGAK